MAKLGLTLARIGECVWTRMEPTPGAYDWGWLDRAIETLGAAGLKVVLGTPAATPAVPTAPKSSPPLPSATAKTACRGVADRQ